MKTNHESEFISYNARFFVLGVIFSLNFASSLIAWTYAGIPTVSSSFYDSSMLAINMFSMVSFLAYPFTSPVASFLLDKFGLFYGLLPGVLLNVSGALLRFIACFFTSPGSVYGVAMFGQVMAALGQPFLLNSTETMANVWFPPTSRASANIVATLGNIIGSAVTLLMVPALLMYRMNIILLIILVITIVLTLPFSCLPSKPKTPPSFTATVPTTPLQKGFLELMRNKDFVCLSIFFSTMLAVGNTLLSLVTQMLLPYGYSEAEGSLAGGVMVFAGIIGALVFGLVLDRYQAHIFILRMNMCFVTCLLVGFVILLRPNSLHAIYCVSGLFGFFGLGLLPLGLELGVECSFPVDPSMSTGLLWLCSNFFTVVVFFYSDGALRCWI